MRILANTDIYPVARRRSLQLPLGLFIALHIPLALLMNAAPLVATVHALAALAVGLWLAVSSRDAWKITGAAAYIVGAEVLWRMTGAGVFWEFGKYAVVAVLGMALLRMRKWKSAGLPLLFFGLLAVSIPFTLYSLSLSQARQEISFNLSGPLCLAVSALFFTQIKLDWDARQKIAGCITAPILGIAALCVYGIATATEIIFTTESNFTTSGGYGPNQVSAVLGLGALPLILVALQTRRNSIRWAALLAAMSLAVLSGLTFSRGGLYNLAAAVLVAAVFLIRYPRLRATFLPIALLTAFIGGFYLFPRLNEYTGGMFGARFADTDPTNRLDIMQSELEIWKQSPILGVGPGIAKYISADEFGMKIAAHTEYTRILAEHGIPGILSILLLIAFAIRAVIKAPAGMAQAWTAALLAWPLVEMTHAAMRIAAIGFVFGLALAGWYTDEQKAE